MIRHVAISSTETMSYTDERLSPQFWRIAGFAISTPTLIAESARYL
jgi:hypothetical protein